MIIAQQLISLIPLACQWVEEQEQLILSTGIPLNEKQKSFASKMGIINIDKIRLSKVDIIPESVNPILKQAGKTIGYISSDTLAITFRYGIYIRSDYWEKESLIIHELTHTLQYERLDGITNFLNQYIKECVYLGYHKSPLELEAKRMEEYFKINSHF